MSPKRSAVRKFDTYLPAALQAKEYANSEGGEVELHKKYTQSGDLVTIIGGGRGVTTVHAAWKAGPDGRVVVFEGSKDMVEVIEDTAQLNDVADICEIRHSLVGPGLNVYSKGPCGAEHVHPESLPKCDVLEMDCEGAEIEILTAMTIQPDLLIIEVHPRRYSSDAVTYLETLSTELSNRGYQIEDYRTNEGEPLSRDEFMNICHTSINEEPRSPVVAAVHQSSDRVTQDE